MNPPVEGATRTFERTFTVEDVEQFAELSGDAQSRHTEPDDDGRVMVQGLLTATMPTKLGSDSEVLARTLEQAAAIGLEAKVLAPWYDIDDAATFRLLQDEIAGLPPAFAADGLFGGQAPATRALLTQWPDT